MALQLSFSVPLSSVLQSFGDWVWSSIRVLAGVAPLFILGTVVVASLSLLQKAQTDKRDAWWRRTEWAVGAALSDDEQKRATGVAAMTSLETSNLASPEDKDFWPGLPNRSRSRTFRKSPDPKSCHVMSLRWRLPMVCATMKGSYEVGNMATSSNLLDRLFRRRKNKDLVPALPETDGWQNYSRGIQRRPLEEYSFEYRINLPSKGRIITTSNINRAHILADTERIIQSARRP